MIKYVKNKKGMTLVETIAGMMLFAVIALSVAAIIAPMLRTYIMANRFAEYNTIIDNAANHIIGDLHSITEPIADDMMGIENQLQITVNISNTVTYTADGGILTRNQNGYINNPMPDSFYKGNKIGFTCDRAPGSYDGEAYVLTVFIFSEEDGRVRTKDFAVKPLLLNQYN
ncbi:MAG: prepilin-type N-terminal cleavage/methylation domain-containing protein [Oscillospiraceae bacterium]|nr:prepilin-type N-terminal cleavage/methylation domain-containing protein [Oscillospiraceae bacterium]